MSIVNMKCLRFFILFISLWFTINSVQAEMIYTCKPPYGDIQQRKERIEFAVKWWFVPLVETYMETYRLQGDEEVPFFLLTHQAAPNTFWNDRMEAVVNSKSLLPCQTETFINGKDAKRKESIIFDRDAGIARFSRHEFDKDDTIVDSLAITPTSMDPLSAFYYLRKRLSPDNPYLELKGISGSRRFVLKGNLVTEEKIKVPVGDFKTYRLECSLEYWSDIDALDKEYDAKDHQKKNPFTLWVSQDEHRFPLQIRYHLALGSLLVQAKSLQYDDRV